ncbi:MAG: rod shape-determining protein MreC [Clostridia bacterium]|nr:rod shape-determining protein MreC [Clostridia bacterium]MBQ4290737.1 rod shape-determining protein MreC [Clostridia bacterium]
MKNNRKHPVLIPLLIVALVCTVVPTLLIATGNTEPVRVVTEAITTPVRNLFYAIGQSCNQFFSRFTEYDKLKEENDRLRQQIISMEQTLSEAEQVLEENAYLKQFLELKENHADYRFLKCEVVSAYQSGYSFSLTLNAGSGEGIAVGYPVITEAGVIGKIASVTANSATVTPITELTFSTGAYVERNNTEGLAEGNYACRLEGDLLFSYLDADADVREGDRIRTSGRGDSFPRGLLLGVIREVRWDAATMTRTAVITPSVRLSEVRDVMILTEFAVLSEEEPGTNETEGESQT